MKSTPGGGPRGSVSLAKILDGEVNPSGHLTATYARSLAEIAKAVPLAESDDGLVPYRSAHLPGAVSEEVITSGHSVQQTALAILEIRRILHLDLDLRPRADPGD